MAGRYVRRLVRQSDSEDENMVEDIGSSEQMIPDGPGTSNGDGKFSGMSMAKVNPMMLVDQFPEDPTMDSAREFWVDWISMIKLLFKLNPSTFRSDEMRITLLITRGGAFLRNILANINQEYPETFDEAVETIEEYLRANSNPLADEANFGTLMQEEGESFQKFSDRVKKKARVFRLEENRVIAQITRGGKQSEKLMDFGLRGKTSLVELVGYGNQLEVLLRNRKLEVKRENDSNLPSEVNILRMKQGNRFNPYRKFNDETQHNFGRNSQSGSSGYGNKGGMQPIRNANDSCGFCGLKHQFGKCPAYGKICNSCNKKNHFMSVCRNRAPSWKSDTKLEAKVISNSD